MKNNWIKTTLGDFLSLQRGHDLTEPERRDGSIPVMGSAGPNGLHDTALAKGPGIVIGRSGASFGQVHLSKCDFWPHNTGLYVTDFKGNDPLFAYYFLKTIDFTRFNSGSAQPSLNRNFIYPIPVRIPPLAEQKRIAGILGALDDKIELNRKMNETLEQMAKALFKSWFVDFDPVHAKVAGSQPVGMDKKTAALFPDSFVDSEMGKIPKGWRVGTISEIATNPRRGIQPGDITPGTPYIGLEHMPRRSIALGDWADSSMAESGKTAFKKDEILFGKLRPYFHKVGLAPVDGICSTDILVLSPISENWHGPLLCIASSDELIQFTNLASTGTKMPRTNWADIGSFKIAMPTLELATAFTKIISNLTEKIAQNLRESKTLTSTRDALIPQLLATH